MHTNTTHNKHTTVDDVCEPHTQPSVCIAFVTTYTRRVAMPEVLETMEKLVPLPGCGLLHADKAKARSVRVDHLATCIHSHNRTTTELRHHAHPTHRICIIHTCINREATIFRTPTVTSHDQVPHSGKASPCTIPVDVYIAVRIVTIVVDVIDCRTTTDWT